MEQSNREPGTGNRELLDRKQPPPSRERDSLCAVVGAELVEDGGDVKLDRPFGDPQLVGDLAVGLAGGDEPKDLELARRQETVRFVRRARLARELGADGRRQI